ncbi:hypothetical protein FB107DRAFT_273400 [Schizophyllum commune]
MHELIAHAQHFYLVLGYVVDGQMLDYLIPRTRLLEPVAHNSPLCLASIDYRQKVTSFIATPGSSTIATASGFIKIVDYDFANPYDPAAYCPALRGSFCKRRSCAVIASVTRRRRHERCSFGDAVLARLSLSP